MKLSKGTTILLVCLWIVFLIPQRAHPEEQLENTYLSLFADSLRNYTGYNEFSGDRAIIEMWIYCYASFRGVMGLGFRVFYPDNVVQYPQVINSEFILSEHGTLDLGVMIYYSECQWDIHWVYRQKMVVTDHEYSYIYIRPNYVNHCEPITGRERGLLYWGNMLINYTEEEGPGRRICREPLEVFTPVENYSWGAIKSIYKGQ